MLGVDTNILVRFFTRDDDNHAELARRIITARENQPIHVSLITLVELVWVLTKVKRWPAADVFTACRELLSSDDFLVEHDTVAQQCLIDAEQARCDFADALIAMFNQRAGCRTTATFDRAAQNLSGMDSVEDLL